MKKFFALLLCITVLIFSSISVANAKSTVDKLSNVNDNQLTTRLSDIGFNQDQLNKMSKGVKNNIASDSSVKKLLSFKTQSIQIQPKSTKTNLISPMGTISTSDLSFNIIAVELADINGLPAVRIYEDFQWLTYPVWTLTDHLALIWTPGWYANSYNMVYSYTNASTGQPMNGYGDAYEILRSSGIAWDYDIKSNMFNYSPWPSGYAYVNLTKNDPSLPANSYSSAEGIYVHDYDFASVRINITPSSKGGVLPGFNLGGDSGNNKAVRSVSWYNTDIFD